jgi:tRNA/tmRNA/rRNA uracil-C5-methylase (TrmA/RlmC/RlmD family)
VSNLSQVFKLFSTDIKISKERENYNSLRLVFVSLADKLSKQFIEMYNKENRNLDDVCKNAYNQGSVCISVAMNHAIESFVKLGIYDMDHKVFINDYYLQYHVWDDYFNQLNDKYLEIMLNQEQLDAYRRARREGRGKLIGGDLASKVQQKA